MASDPMTPAAGAAEGLRDLPKRVVVDQHGHYWRDYGEFWSMCPVSEENVETTIAAIYVRDYLDPVLDAVPSDAPEKEAPDD